MPSTFTSNTGIEKIADGEQSGLWGQTTNLNFDIVDRALNGSVDVTLSGTTHTLTTSDGILSDGQFAVLVFTGSPSGTNTVTIAPNTAQKLYWVRNTTSQTVVLSQGSGANVSIPAGLSKVVYSNGAGAGAAVFDITNTLSGNITGNVTGDVTGDVTGSVTGSVTGDVTGNVTGNADTATALQTARTIGGVSFDGTANINLPGVNAAGNQDTTGNAATAAAWQTARTFTINGVGKSVDGSADVLFTGPEVGSVPSGGIIMWSGSIASVPTGWFLCDGANGTPDLRDRFVVGAGSTYATGATGGADTVTLTEAQLPSHNHTFSGQTGGFSTNHNHTPSGGGNFFRQGAGGPINGIQGGNSFTGGITTVATTDVANTDHSHSFSGTTASVGSGQAHENRPPYFALAYIMKA